MIRPRLGLILLRAEWFNSVVALPELTQAMDADAAQIRLALQEQSDLVDVWIVSSAHSLVAAEAAIRSADIDLFIIAFQVWAEDFYLLPLVRAIGSRPALLWAYQPWRRLPEYLPFLQVLRGSGPVGSLEGMGTLKNLEFPYLFTYGSPEDPRVQAEILQAGRAAWLQRALRSARIGLLPYRNEQMQSTFVDEFRLLRDLGLSVQHLSIGDLVRTSESLLDIEVEDFTNALLRDFPLRGVTRETLAQAARASLALAYLAAENGLDVLSYNDIAPESHQVFGMRPCLYPPLYDQAGVLVTLEGDLGAASAALIMNRLTGSPIFFS